MRDYKHLGAPPAPIGRSEKAVVPLPFEFEFATRYV